MQDLFKILKSKKSIKISFKGFPKCIYYRDILHSRNVFHYQKQIFYLETKYNNSPIFDNCNTCKYKLGCSFISKNYEIINGNKEFLPIFSNKDLSIVIINKLNLFKTDLIKNKGFQLLDDFKLETEFLRKRFLFVDSFPNNLNESSKERFVYFIDNRNEDFEDTYKLISNFFNIKKLKSYLSKSSEFALGFSLMGNNNIRETFYFVIENLSKSEIKNLSNILNLKINFKDNYWGIGIDKINSEIVSKKVYYKKINLSKDNLIIFFGTLLKNNSKIKDFLYSINKNINSVLFDYKYKSEKLFSKKLELSMQFDKHNYEVLSNILDIDLKYFKKKDFYTISFEININGEEKINFYYGLK